MPARVLLAGKIAGIGFLGLAQIGVTALAALVAITAFHSIDVPAIRGAVLAWVVIWFVLGYILYATIYGALGSLGSRVEDAQSVAGPISVVLVVAYFASFAMIGQPTSVLARAISYFPLTAPMAMPGRIAMGATTWWEPLTAAALTLAATLVLVRIAGRLYTSAILHGGPRLSLRGAWQGRPDPGPATASVHTTTAPHSASAPARATTTASPDVTSHRLLITVLVGVGVLFGTVMAVLTSDVILGVIVGAGFIAVAIQMVKLWTGHAVRLSPITESWPAGRPESVIHAELAQTGTPRLTAARTCPPAPGRRELPGALSRCRRRSSLTAAYPRVDSPQTISRRPGQGLGFQQVAQHGQVQSGELEEQGGGYRREQRRVGQGAGADPGARRDSELGRAEREEGHALPGPAGGMTPDRYADGHRSDHHADPDDALP